MGTELVGDHLSRGTKGPINWGQIVGDQMSGDHMCLGPNVSQPTSDVFLCTHMVATHALVK